jgi:hypothetical protein
MMSETASRTQQQSALTNNAKSAQLVAEIELRPGEQLTVTLGVFTELDSPKGFSIYVKPEPEEDALVAQITQLKQDNTSSKWMMLIANYSTATINAEVRRV